MLQAVNTVLIGKTCPASYTNVDALVAGDVAIFDENRKLIATAADAVNAKALHIGVAQDKVSVTLPDGSVALKANIEFSNQIQKGISIKDTMAAYVAPVKESIAIDLSGATITVGNSYSLRIIYKDIFEHPGQFSHTYEVIATSTTAANLATALAAKINKHSNRRVNAVVAGDVLTITAMDKDDNEGVNSINEYSIVSMEASLTETNPTAIFTNPTVVSAVYTKVKGNPGKGFWKQVRDAEVRNMGYKGHVFIDSYPIIEQDRKVEKDASYDYMIIENENSYLSSDNQYLKNTPITTELYVKTSGLFPASVARMAIQSFIKGVEVVA